MSVLPVLLIVLPLAGALLVAGWPGRAADRYAPLAGAVVSGITLVVAVVALFGFDYATPGRVQMETDASWVPGLALRLHLGVDGISLPLVVLTALLSFCCLLYGVRHTPAPGRPRALVATLLLLEVGMLGTFVALDLLLFFVFFEIVLVPMYAVIAIWGGAGRRAAAYKFILYTLLGSALMLVGFLVVWAQTGTLDMVELADRGGEGMGRTVQLAAFLAIGAGFAVKAPMWPLHTWLPDAHTEAPTVGSVLLAGVLLKMGTYGFVRIALPVVPEGAEQAAPWLGVLAVVGILYGSLACLAQVDLKRLIAYSSVGHMGFVLLGIATLTPAGINGALFANVAHGLITGLLFFLVGGIKDRTGTTDIAALGGGLYARSPRLGGLLAFGAVASLGLPGLAGFWGEMLAMLGAFRPGEGLDRGLFLVLMAGAGVGAVLTATYLLVVVRRVAQGAPERIGDPLPDVARIEWAAWAPLVALALVLGLWPDALLGLSDPAVANLPGVANAPGVGS
ncbi:MAG: complex I subunit 4 family protein [Actinomycetes bacterium]